MYNNFLTDIMQVRRLEVSTIKREQVTKEIVIYNNAKCMKYYKANSLGTLIESLVSKIMPESKVIFYTRPEYEIRAGDIVEHEGEIYTVEATPRTKRFLSGMTSKQFTAIKRKI